MVSCKSRRKSESSDRVPRYGRDCIRPKNLETEKLCDENDGVRLPLPRPVFPGKFALDPVSDGADFDVGRKNRYKMCSNRSSEKGRARVCRSHTCWTLTHPFR
ncbi:hypothetical protein VTI28DRAFT_1081 [Corynascus sepedonium]